MSWYRNRMERDLARWQAAGWVSDTGATAIRGELAQRKPAFGAASVLAVLGAVLFGFAIMSFVAANWSAMPKLLRLALLIGTLWACYGGAAYLLDRKLDMFAHAAILAGIGVFGGSIMLIAQMYHMEGHPPDAMLVWALGALLAAVLARSHAALGAAFVLMAAWSIWERSLSEIPHWGFLAGLIATGAVAAWLKWRPGLHLGGLSLLGWLVPLGFVIADHHAHWLVVALGLLGAGAAVAFAPAIDRHLNISSTLFTYAGVAAYAGLFIMQFIDHRGLFGSGDTDSIPRLLGLAIVALVLLLAAMLWAIKSDNRAALWLGYTGFAVQIFALYVRTLGTYLDTSLFFLISAVIVSALAWAAYRLHQRGTPAKAAAA